MFDLFIKKKELDNIRKHKIDEMRAELECTVKIYTEGGGYKEYGIADKKLKSEFVSCQLPFDNEKALFEIQCSKDGENFVKVNPWAVNSGKRMAVNPKPKFPTTLAECVNLVDFIARSSAETIDGDTDFKYWRIGIDWEVGFVTWFSGDIGSPVINRNDMSMTDNFISHLEG